MQFVCSGKDGICFAFHALEVLGRFNGPGVGGWQADGKFLRRLRGVPPRHYGLFYGVLPIRGDDVPETRSSSCVGAASVQHFDGLPIAHKIWQFRTADRCHFEHAHPTLGIVPAVIGRRVCWRCFNARFLHAHRSCSAWTRSLARHGAHLQDRVAVGLCTAVCMFQAAITDGAFFNDVAIVAALEIFQRARFRSTACE